MLHEFEDQKNAAKEFSKIVKVYKALNSHSTNMIIENTPVVVLLSNLKSVYSYAIIRDEYVQNLYEPIMIENESMRLMLKTYRKSKCTIMLDTNEKSELQLAFKQNDEIIGSLPHINNLNALYNIKQLTYQPLINLECSNLHLMEDISSTEFIKFSSDLIERMSNSNLCKFMIEDYPIYIAKPFLGNLSKTLEVMYRVVMEDSDKFILQFKQEEEIGYIYTYAAFLKVTE